MRAATEVYFMHLVGRDLQKGSGQTMSFLAFKSIRMRPSPSKVLCLMHRRCWGTAHPEIFTSAHNVWCA